jgi:hypothetical protein
MPFGYEVHKGALSPRCVGAGFNEACGTPRLKELSAPARELRPDHVAKIGKRPSRFELLNEVGKGLAVMDQ